MWLNIWRYIVLMAKTFVSKAFWLGDALGFFALFFSVAQPKLSWYVTAGVFELLLLSAGYSVWNKERRRDSALEHKIKELEDKIPTFSVSVTSVSQFTVDEIIASRQQEIKTLEAKINAAKNPYPARMSVISPLTGGALSS